MASFSNCLTQSIKCNREAIRHSHYHVFTLQITPMSEWCIYAMPLIPLLVSLYSWGNWGLVRSQGLSPACLDPTLPILIAKLFSIPFSGTAPLISFQNSFLSSSLTPTIKGIGDYAAVESIPVNQPVLGHQEGLEFQRGCGEQSLLVPWVLYGRLPRALLVTQVPLGLPSIMG